jgi:nucleoside-diphosphate-sugar epimerase
LGFASEEAEALNTMTRLLLTGATGFIGSSLLDRLVESDLGEDFEINVIERYVTGRYGTLNRTIATHFADLRDFSAVRSIVKLVQPDIVIHLAAISPVSYSYDHPSEVMETNLQGTINLAEACRKNCENLEAFIFAGTTEEYGTTPDRPASEESRCFPNSPYSVSKHAATEYLFYLFRAFEFPSIISRATNTYGRKSDTHFFVEKLVFQMLRNPTGKVYVGETEQIRDFMYVDDHAGAYLTLLQKREKCLGKIFNFATGESRPLYETIEIISKLTDFKGEIISGTIPKRPLDIYDHLIDSSRARTELGWKHDYDLQSGLKKTIEFWRKKLLNVPVIAK